MWGRGTSSDENGEGIWGPRWEGLACLLLSVLFAMDPGTGASHSVIHIWTPGTRFYALADRILCNTRV